MGTRRRLVDVIASLHREYGDPFLPPSTDPFGLVLWEQVAYLATDVRRSQAFDRLAAEVGLTPADVERADLALLTAIARTGGATAAAERAGRMRASAEIVVTQWDGDLRKAGARPYSEARKAMSAFPMIGPPGADKILLLSGAHPVLALDSNGVRVLLRLGYGVEASDYGRTYASVQTAASAECLQDVEWLARAYGLLRWHGQRTCRRNRPACARCVVEPVCPGSEARPDAGTGKR